MNRFALLLLLLLLTAISTARAEQFSLVVLPDTQGETGATPPTMFTAQCQWITNNAAAQNIKMVLHVGDIVNWDTPDSNPPHYMYVNASNGYNMLDAFGIHYANANGNHDNQATGGKNPDGTPCHCSGSAAPGDVHANLRDTSVMNQFFPPSRFTLCRGLFESNKQENAYHTFSAGGLNWLVINTETDPRQAVLDWFTNVVASHPNHNVIYVTHNFLTSNGSIAGGVGYGDDTPTQVWNELLNAYSNVRMVFCGHVDTAARRNDVAAHGNHVYSMLSDYQDENAGNGWLRLVQVDTIANTISVQTYSPYVLSNRTDSANQFSFTGVSWVSADPNGGTGLTGEYFGDTNLSTLKLTRTDGSVDFNWGNGFPVPTVGTNNFSVRWSGQVQPEYSETYTFSTITDDGVRLWVNGQLLIDKWVDQAPAEWTGSIALTAHQKYSIKMEYYQHAGGACAKLLWRSPSTPRAIIPQTDLFPQPPIPAPPGGLTATAGETLVALNWSASSGATNYNVKRATASGGPYTTVASQATTSYTDTTVANGTTYYYVVSASNGGGESANSTQASATPFAASINVPNFGFESPGTTNYVYDPSGASWTFTGNAGVSSNYTGFTGRNPVAPQGVQVAFLQRTCSVAQALSGFVPGTTYTVTFAAAQRGYSQNGLGQTWNVQIDSTVVASYAPPQSATNYVDYTATFTATAANHTLAFMGTDTNSQDNTILLDNVRVAASLPSPWQTADLGAVAATGSASYNSGTFTVAASGADIWNTADEFRYIYQSSSGDCSMVAKVASLQNTDPWAKAGVMVRETTASNAINVAVLVTPGNGITFQWRTSTGGTSSSTNQTGLTAPYWVKLTRTGSSFAAYYSSNGTSWTQLGTAQTVTMATSATIGLAVTSHKDGTLCTATISNVTATP